MKKKQAKKTKAKIINSFKKLQKRISEQDAQIEAQQDMIEEYQKRYFININQIDSLETTLKSAESAIVFKDAAVNETACFVKKMFDS